MDDATFVRLLHEGESPTLDFKKEQYRFVKATEEEKSELLKDILGFANNFRRSEAYILIGVEDVQGGRANVVGIPAPQHLADHSLQQFVSSLTNAPILFHYEAFGFENKQVGVIRIEQQSHRPFFLKNKDYGKLKKGEVYIRRGSSTDPTKPADPSEIVLMGRASVPQNADLVVEFADVEKDERLGTQTAWASECCKMPENIPDHRGRSHHVFGMGRVSLAEFGINADYFRELAEYEFKRRLCHPVRLAVKNVGEVAAHLVRVELMVQADGGVRVLDSCDLPDPPIPRRDFLSPTPRAIDITPVSRHPGQVIIEANNTRFRIDMDCGDLQPGRVLFSDIFYVAKHPTGELVMNGHIFAENLPKPKAFTLCASINVIEVRMSVEELTALPVIQEHEQ